jgi:hypothetical protein
MVHIDPTLDPALLAAALDFDDGPLPILTPARVAVPARAEIVQASERSDDRRTLFLGIDPGLDGFAALIDAKGVPVEECHVPLIGDGEYDLPAMAELCRGWGLVTRLAFLEKQQAMGGFGEKCPTCKKPKNQQGATSTFTTGMGYGLWRMALAFAGIRAEHKRGQDWKKKMGIQPTSGLTGNERTREAKRLAIEKAQALFPGYDLRQNERGRVPHSGKCEAMLMAEYARRLQHGE